MGQEFGKEEDVLKSWFTYSVTNLQGNASRFSGERWRKYGGFERARCPSGEEFIKKY